MAERRMFTKKVTDDDNFMALSASAQSLYFHLNMCADDDGFCNQVQLSMFKAHASVADLEVLLQMRYIYQFENGVIVIKHWRMANALRKDRYTPTVFQDELRQLGIKEDGTYTWLPDGCQMVATSAPQDRLGKDSIDQDNINTVQAEPEHDVKANRKKEAAELFERLWKLYPSKKGKGQVSDSKKMKLLAIGYEEMERAIKRYVSELDKDTWRKPQNGSTFFNSGYVDYLDVNFVPSSQQKPAYNPNNQFNNFQQREYTSEQMKEIEQKLLGNG